MVIVWGTKIKGETKYIPGAVLCGLGCIGFAAGYFMNKGRALRKLVYPKLTRAVAPLRPSIQEFRAALEEAGTAGFKLANRLDAAHLLDRMRATGPAKT